MSNIIIPDRSPLQNTATSSRWREHDAFEYMQSNKEDSLEKQRKLEYNDSKDLAWNFPPDVAVL